MHVDVALARLSGLLQQAGIVSVCICQGHAMEWRLLLWALFWMPLPPGKTLLLYVTQFRCAQAEDYFHDRNSRF